MLPQKYCTECGHQNSNAARFCIACGNQFETAPPQATPPPLPPIIPMTTLSLKKGGDVVMETLGQTKRALAPLAQSSLTRILGGSKSIAMALTDKSRRLGWVFLILWVVLSFGLPLGVIYAKHGRVLLKPPKDMVLIGTLNMNVNSIAEQNTRGFVPVKPQLIHAARWPFGLLYTLPFLLSPLLILSWRRLFRGGRVLGPLSGQTQNDTKGAFAVTENVLRPEARLDPLKQYYYLDDHNEAIGPHTPEELGDLARRGMITGMTLVAEESSQEWKPLGSINGGRSNQSQP